MEIANQPNALPMAAAHGRIESDPVSFANVSGRRALDDASFTIEPGRLAALVGPSGAGKTTITYLVSRFYDPDAGSVRIDGQDVRSLDLRTLSEPIGIVTQETYLTTIRENIAYGRPSASLEDIVTAREGGVPAVVTGPSLPHERR